MKKLGIVLAIALAASAAFADPAPKFAVFAHVVNPTGSDVWSGHYTGHDPFDTQAACEAWLKAGGDDTYKDGNVKLEQAARAAFGDGVKVTYACEALDDGPAK